MALNTQNTDAISFKKLSGKAHTQQNFAVSEESISSNVQLSYSTIFGDQIVSLPVTDSGLTTLYSTNGIVERVKFQVDLISDTEILAGRSQGYRLKLPSDYSTYGELRNYFASGTYLNTSLGRLQIVPSTFGTLKPDGSTEYDPILYQTNGSSEITKFDPINWYLDRYNGILFVQDPPAGYDVSAARPGFVEAFLYVGEYLDDVVDVITSGTTGTTANNVGGGVGVFKDKTAEILNFRSLVGVSGVSVTQTTNNIYIGFTGETGGGGGGTITGATNGLSVTGKKIKLGGEITGTTSISEPNGWSLNIGDDQGNTFVGKFGVLTLGGIDLETTNNIRITSDVLTVQTGTVRFSGDTMGYAGIQYFDNYGANFGARSVPDVAWVTGYTAGVSPNIGGGNGLSKVGNNIVLGGDLTGNTSIGAFGAYALTIGDLSGTGPVSDFELNALNSLNINSISGVLGLNSNAGVTINNTSGNFDLLSSGKIRLEANGYNLEFFSIGNQITMTGNSIYMRTFNTFTVSGATGFAGVRYANNYASNFDARSLVDAAYVTGLTNQLVTTANNGINKIGSNFRLGGTLTGNTTISGNTTLNIIDNSIELGNTSNSLLVQRFAYNVGTGFNVSTNYGGGAVQADGKVILGGGFSSYNGVTANRIIRLNYDGTIDTTFVTGTGLFGSGIAGRGIIAQTDGKIMIVGSFTSYSGATANRIIRLNANGSIDSTFVSGTGFDNATASIVQQSDGKYVVAGGFTTYSGITGNDIVRLNSNGSHDATFVSGAGFTGGAAAATAIALQTDGKIVAVGNFTAYSGVSKSNIVRLNTNGSVDSSFNTLAFNNAVSNVVIQPDGKIIVGGAFTTYNAVTQNFILRLNSDGSKDTTFNVGTGFVGSFVSAITLQSDGKILVAGEFTSYNGTSRNRIIRLNSDGSVDTSFVIGTGFNTGSGGITSILLEPNGSGRMVVFGSFTTYNGLSRNRVIKLDTYGSALGNTLISSRPAEYTTDMSSIFGNRSLVDKGFVVNAITSAIASTTINRKRVEIATASSVTATTESNFIGCSGSTANVYLPAVPVSGQEIIVTDVQGDGLTNPITIHGNGKLLDGSTTAEIDSEFGSITFLYNGITWSIIAYAA